MLKLCWIAFAAPRKSYRIGLLLIQKNGWGGLYVTERSYGPAPISKAESLVGGRGGGGYCHIYPAVKGIVFKQVTLGLGI